ncbi:hypothetical protein Tco_0669717 [Tanacetum coccineum]
MTTLKFADTHNMVAFLAKPAESEGFEQIVDFLNAHPIKYALTVNPIIYTSCIKQFWATVKAKTVNGEVQLQALVDGMKIIITESIMKRDIQLEDAEGVDCLPNSTIFEQLTLMGYVKLSQKLTFYKAFFSQQWKFLIHTILQCLSAKTTAWNEFSSTIAYAIICLATNQKFNFSKYIFESMVKNLDNVSDKFLMYPIFIQVFLDKQLEGMSNHKRIYIAPSHTKKIFGNMRRGEGSTMPIDPRHTPTIIQPSTSQPQKKQRSRRSNRKDTQVPQPSGSTKHVADESVNEEMDDSLVRAATTTSSFEAEQDSGNIIKTRSKATPNEAGSQGNTSGGVNTPRSDEDRLKLNELMKFCTKLQQRVLDLENTKTAQAQEITSLKLRVKRLENKEGSRTYKLKRLYKVGRIARVISSNEASLGDQDDASKQGRKINDIDKDVEITLVDETQGRYGDDLMFDTGVLDDEEVFVGQDMAEKEINVVEKEVSTVDPVTTAGEVVTTASVEITMIDADYQMAQQMQAEEPEKSSIEEKSKLFVQLLEARKKHFAAIRAQEKRNKPPTKAQKRKTMYTYLKNKAGYKHNQLKYKSFDDIHNEVSAEGSQTRTEGSFKRPGEELEQESSKKQKLEQDKESEELKKCLEIVPYDGDDVTIDATPLSIKFPSIVD